MGCGFSKESTICRNLSRLFSRHPTRQNDDRSAEGNGPKAERVSLSSRHSPCRSSREFGREQPGFADLSQPIPPEDLGENPTQPSASPMRAHYIENIVQELETLRSLVNRYVNKHFGQASEVERRKICLRIYRLVIDYAQDNTSSRTRRCLLDQRRLLCVG
jgi:hypothetical protein